MAYLLINGVEFEWAVKTGGRKWVEAGESTIALSGVTRRTPTATKIERDLASIPLPDAEVYAWERLLLGHWHNFRFDAADPVGFYSLKNLTATETGAVTPNGASGKYDKRVTIPAAANLQWTPVGVDALAAGDYNPQGDYSLGAWLLTATGPDVWTHYLVRRYAGAVTWYENGVINGGAAPTWLIVTAGVLQLGDASERIASDLFAVPYAIPTAWALAWGTRATAFPRLPFVEVGGDLVGAPSTARLMRASDVKSEAEALATDNYGKRLSFTLREK